MCGIIYRHPNSNLELFLTSLYSTIDTIYKEKKLRVLAGDFNIDLLNYESHHFTEEFINTLNTYFFEPHILKPTRVTIYSATLIDNYFLNSSDFKTFSYNIIYDLTDHLPNFLIINSLDVSSRHEKIYKRDFSNYDTESLTTEFNFIDWTAK